MAWSLWSRTDSFTNNLGKGKAVTAWLTVLVWSARTPRKHVAHEAQVGSSTLKCEFSTVLLLPALLVTKKCSNDGLNKTDLSRVYKPRSWLRFWEQLISSSFTNSNAYTFIIYSEVLGYQLINIVKPSDTIAGVTEVSCVWLYSVPGLLNQYLYRKHAFAQYIKQFALQNTPCYKIL